MRQTLFYIPETLFGLPLFGFGLVFWAILIGTAVAILLRTLKHGFDKECLGYLPMLLFTEVIVAYIVPLVVQKGQGFPIRGYGFFLLLAISSASALLIYRAKKLWNIPPDTVISLALWGVVSGLIGARLFFVIQYHEDFVKDSLLESLISIVSITEGGLVVYGSILGGILGAMIFMIKNKLPILATFDLVAPTVLLGMSLGRLGCLMNGCCFGGLCELPWAVQFPAGSPVHLHQLGHDQTFFAGLKFLDEERSVDERNSEPVSLDAGDDVTVTLEKYARAKRSRLVIEEVQADSAAEKAGIKPGMNVIAIGLFVPQEGHSHEHSHENEQAEEKQSLRISLLKNRCSILTCMQEAITEHVHDIALAIAVPENEGANAYRMYKLPLEPYEVRPVHPTQVYSAICAALGCVILITVSRFCNKDGQILVLFLFGYSVVRFVIEEIRTDEGSFMGSGLTISQNVSLLVFLAAVLLAIYVAKSPKTRAYTGMFPGEEPVKKKTA